MSDKKTVQSETKAVGSEPKAGEGMRSLDTWKKLAAARHAAAGNEEARARLSADPSAYLSEFGVNSQAFGPMGLQAGSTQSMTEFEKQLANMNPFRDVQTGVRRGCVYPVVAGACAAVVAGNVAGAVNVAAVENAAYADNVAWTSNWAAGVNT